MSYDVEVEANSFFSYQKYFNKDVCQFYHSDLFGLKNSEQHAWSASFHFLRGVEQVHVADGCFEVGTYANKIYVPSTLNEVTCKIGRGTDFMF